MTGVGRRGCPAANCRETKIPRLSSRYSARSPVRIRARGTSLAIPQSTNGGASARPLDKESKAALLQGGKQDDLADRTLARQQHREPVDPDADPARGRHSVLQRANVVLVERRRVLVARRGVADLLLEPCALVVRIVELGEGVRELHSVRERFEALDQSLVLTMSLCER